MTDADYAKEIAGTCDDVWIPAVISFGDQGDWAMYKVDAGSLRTYSTAAAPAASGDLDKKIINGIAERKSQIAAHSRPGEAPVSQSAHPNIVINEIQYLPIPTATASTSSSTTRPPPSRSTSPGGLSREWGRSPCRS